MNSFIIFAIFLQVLMPLCRSCSTSNGEEGVCTTPSDCKASQPLAKCNNWYYVCCPTTVRSQIGQLDESKFPKDCGFTPMHPRVQIAGGKLIKADEYFWLASLRYGNQSSYRLCGASVINSRYLLTAAHCVKGNAVTEAGGLTAARLGKFNEKGEMCDYGTEECKIFEDYAIEKIISHSEFNANDSYVGNDIALIRVAKPIQFTNVTQPICLPFGSNFSEEPPHVNNVLIVSGWGLTMEKNETVAKRDVAISLWETSECSEHFTVDETHLCAVETGKNSCNGDSGGPLMQQFAPKRMVLEGIVSYGIEDCKNTEYPGVYTRVRNFGEWLNSKMEM